VIRRGRRGNKGGKTTKNLICTGKQKIGRDPGGGVRSWKKKEKGKLGGGLLNHPTKSL